MAKESKPGEQVEGEETPATVAGMTAERFAQYARLQALKTAEAHGRVHAKGAEMILGDAELFHGWVMTGKGAPARPAR